MELTSSSWVVVPQGWQRELEGTIIYYLSPDNRKLSSLEEVITHLVSEGTCKCGLRCPVDVKKLFDFDPDKIPLPDHDENVLPEHSHCKKDRRPKFRKFSMKSQKAVTPDKAGAKTDAVSPELSASTPPKKSVGVKRTMSFALLPEVRVSKKLKFAPKTFTVTSSSKIDGNKKKRRWSSGRMKLKNSCQSSEEDEVSKTKKLMSLLKKTNITLSTDIPGKSANKQMELALKSPPTNSASGGGFVRSRSQSGYCNVQEILKQAKLSLSRESIQNPMLIEEPLPLTHNSNSVSEKSSAPSTNSKEQLVSNSSKSGSNQVTPSPEETLLSPIIALLKTNTNISSETQKHVPNNASSTKGTKIRVRNPFQKSKNVTATTKSDCKDSDVDIKTMMCIDEGTTTTVLSESCNQATINHSNLNENQSAENTSSPMSVQHVENMNFLLSKQPFPTITDPRDDELGYLMDQLLPDPMDDITTMDLGGGAPVESGGNHLPPTLLTTEVETNGITQLFNGKTVSETFDGNMLALLEETSSFKLPSSQELSKLMQNAMELADDTSQVAMPTNDNASKACSVRSSTSPLDSPCLGIGDQNCLPNSQKIEADPDPLEKVTTLLHAELSSNVQDLNRSTEHSICDNDDGTSQNESAENKLYSLKSGASTPSSPGGIAGQEDIDDVRIQETEHTTIQNNGMLKSDDEESITDNLCKADSADSPELSGHDDIMPQSNAVCFDSLKPSQVNPTNTKSEATIPDLEPPSLDTILNTNSSLSNIQPCTKQTVDMQPKNSNSNNHEMQSPKQHSTDPVIISDQSIDSQSEGFRETLQPSEDQSLTNPLMDTIPSEDQDSQATTNPSMDKPSENQDSYHPLMDKPSEDQDSQSPSMDTIPSEDQATTNPPMDKPSEDQDSHHPLMDKPSENQDSQSPSMDTIPSEDQATTNPSIDKPSKDQDSHHPSMDKPSEDQDSQSPSMDTIQSEDQATTNPSMDKPSKDQDSHHPSIDKPSEDQDSQSPSMDTIPFEDQATTNPSMDTIPSEDQDSQATNPSMDKPSEDQESQSLTNPLMDTIPSEDQDSQATTKPSEDQDSHNPLMDLPSEDQDSQVPTNPSMDTTPFEDQDSQATTNPSMDKPSEDQDSHNPLMDKPSEDQDSQSPSMDTIPSEDQDSNNPLMDVPSEDQDSQAPTNPSMDTIPSEDQDSQAPTNPSMDTIPSEDQGSQAPTNPSISTFLVEQFLGDDQQSGSSVLTRSAQLKSADSFSKPALGFSPLVTDNELSVSHSTSASLKSSVKLENGQTNEPPETTDLINGSGTKTNTEKTMVDHKDDPFLLDFEEGFDSLSNLNFRKLYPTRSKSRPASNHALSLSKVLGKRGRSVPMELKSPFSETSSVGDSVFEEKKCDAPKRGKRKNLTESRPSRKVKVSTPHSSTTSAPDLEPSTAPDTPTEPSTAPDTPTMVGDIVWAKASQLPGWPGRIISHKKRRGMGTPPENMVWVEWFGSGSTVSMVDVANVRPLEEGVKTRGAFKNKKKKKLEKAISLARKALQAK